MDSRVPTTEPDGALLRSKLRWTLRQMFGVIIVGTLTASHFWTSLQLHRTRSELAQLRSEVGFLNIDDDTRVAAARIPDEQPLAWRFRVYNPENNRLRLAYSTRWLSGEANPDWYSYVAIPAGESVIVARIQEDPRDALWKISVVVRQGNSTSRSATELPPPQVAIFRGAHQAISTGEIGSTTLQFSLQSRIKLLQDKWLINESPLVLYGERAPEVDITGVFLEIQPDA